jgi:hypothetical protein
MAAKENSTRSFYVYIHRKATDGTVFYVGKGSGKRAWSKQRNKYWTNVAGKHGYTVEILQNGMQEWWALEVEIDLIAKYGRKNLCNLTDGGDGTVNLSEESKKILSLKRLGTKRSNETKKRLSESVKQSYLENPSLKIQRSEQMKREKTHEHQRKISEKLMKKVTCSNGMIFPSLKDATNWVKLNINHKAYAANISVACLDQKYTSYGFKWFYM